LIVNRYERNRNQTI